MSVAILLCGNIRTLHNCTNRDWINALNYDLYISTYIKQNNYHPYHNYTVEQDINVNALYKEFKNIRGLVVDDGREVDTLRGSCPHAYYQYKCIERCLNLLKKQYDLVVKIRPDMSYNHNMFDNIPRLEPNKSTIYINNNEMYPSDTIFICKKTTLDSIVQYVLEQYKQEVSIDPHTLLQNCIDKLNLIPVVCNFGRLVRPF
jgi:hypothetical protein